MVAFALIIAIVLAYLLGNINSATIISRLVFHKDIRESGSGSAGATNMFRTFGAGWGILTLLLDAAKGYIAYFAGNAIGYFVGGESCASWFAAAAGLFSVIGHTWPVLYQFKGGKGIATTFGVILACHPVVGLIAFGLAILSVLITNYMSIGSLVAAAFAELGCLILGPASVRVLMTVLILLILWQHRSNIQRLFNGAENPMMSRSLLDILRGKNKKEETSRSKRDLK